MSLRFLLVSLFFVTPIVANAAEPWADPKMPVTDGLELWLDSSRIDAAAKGTKEKAIIGGKLAMWPDGSGKGRHVRQSVAERQPTIVKVGDAAVVRFDGDDDRLRLTGGKDELKDFTLFIVLAPRRNLGGFTGFFALNAANGRDYETGLNVDFGPNATPRFTDLNVEGKGFGGWKNLMKNGGDFGKLYQFDVRGNADTVRAVVNGAIEGERTRTQAALSLAEITVGARFYTNGPGEQEVRGAARCDIAEILLYSRALRGDETENGPQVPRGQVRQPEKEPSARWAGRGPTARLGREPAAGADARAGLHGERAAAST